MKTKEATAGFHHHSDTHTVGVVAERLDKNLRLTYTFYNHFHPYVDELLRKLNKDSLDGLLDVTFHQTLFKHFFLNLYHPNESTSDIDEIDVDYFPKQIDVSEKGPYSVYNWELLFHVPFTIAVHLSKNQRFAESQRWFHYIFDPTCNDKRVDPPQRFWKFLRFRQEKDIKQIEELLQILSKPPDECNEDELEWRDLIVSGYERIRENPFQPHAVARTRFLAYQYSVVMKYLDNLIAWGDSLFRQDTIETINEATQLYVLAANILGPRPQEIPRSGKVKPKTFAQLRASGIDHFGNALVELEGQFPFNLYFPGMERVSTDEVYPLFGIGRTLYFCIPRNNKLLSYWDTVADRLFKIRHCMSIEGVVRQLPLFQPPIDPGMLVKAAAAGIDVSSLVSGLNQPMAPVRTGVMIQKALEICSEVRSMGASLLSALEKKDDEALSLLRQKHEINIQKLVQDVHYLHWKEAEESTQSLLRTRAITFERYRHYQLLLGKKEADLHPLRYLSIEKFELTEENFDDVYFDLVRQCELVIELHTYPPKGIQGDSSPNIQSGAESQGSLYLNPKESLDLNFHMPLARAMQQSATDLDETFGWLGLIPDSGVNFSPIGVGISVNGIGGSMLSEIGRVLAGKERALADQENYAGTRAAKTASYERRVEDWIFQSNLAALELMQIGRQIIGSLIREQIARHEYENQKKLIEQSEEIDSFLRDKFSNEELYGWMQGELSKLYYEYYKFAFDIARKAEQTMKHELMRPELDEMNFVKFNYWDGGRKGLLSGEALHLDLKRMEMAYHEHNKREYELTKHVSLRQLDPVALLALKAGAACEVTLPEWLFDLDCPGHYMRRTKSVSVSIPSVTGPYTSVNCTLSLFKSSLRRSALLADGEYARQGSEDERFMDYFGTIQSVVTSSGQNDGGLFEVNLRDERYLPFEGAGVISTWKLELPSEFRQFDYNTISDVILHLRYSARSGGEQMKSMAIAHIQELVEGANTSGLVRLFSLKHEFPNEWHQFISGSGPFRAVVKKDYFPYFAQARTIEINMLELYAITDQELLPARPSGVVLEDLTSDLNDNGQLELTLSEDSVLVREGRARVFLLFRYSLS